MATDYDAPRKNDDESNDDSIEELKGRRNEAATPTVDEDEAEAADGSIEVEITEDKPEE